MASAYTSLSDFEIFSLSETSPTNENAEQDPTMTSTVSFSEQFDEIVQKNCVVIDDIKDGNVELQKLLTYNVNLNEKLALVLISFEKMKTEKAALEERNKTLDKTLAELQGEVSSLSFISAHLEEENRELATQKDNLAQLLTQSEESSSFVHVSQNDDTTVNSQAVTSANPQAVEASDQASAEPQNANADQLNAELQAKYNDLITENESLKNDKDSLSNQLQTEQSDKKELQQEVEQLQEALHESENTCRDVLARLCNAGMLQCPGCPREFESLGIFEKHLQICVQ